MISWSEKQQAALQGEGALSKGKEPSGSGTQLTFHCSLQNVQGTDFRIVIVALEKAKKEISEHTK